MDSPSRLPKLVPGAVMSVRLRRKGCLTRIFVRRLWGMNYRSTCSIPHWLGFLSGRQRMNVDPCRIHPPAI